MSTASWTIPYEKQADPQTSRMCGAACLSMVYRSFGKDIPQAGIWQAIAKVNRFGRLSSTTHLMAQDALGRGLAAVVFQARHPIQALRLCREVGARAILSHRLESNSAAGHYSVLVDLDSKNVFLHDPYYGPSRSVSHDDLLDLWQPKFANAEIVGGVLMAIAEEPPGALPCPFCRTLTPPTIECPHCRKPVALQPSSVLGCMNRGCIARQWNYICCPSCDFMWNSETNLERAGAGVAGSGAPTAPTDPEISMIPATLSQVFEGLDKFVAQVNSIPGVGSNPDIPPLIEGLVSCKAALTAALAEAAGYARVQDGRMAAFVQASEARREAHRKKVEEVNKQGESLDGVALGKALLKNLGFTK